MSDPVLEIEAHLGKGWIQSLADAIAGRPTEWRFKAKDGERCSRCGEDWGVANNTPNSVYHLCLVPRSEADTGSKP
jgi:hypothetical protein